MFHVRDRRRVALGDVREAYRGGRESREGARRSRPHALLLPPHAPFQRGTHRRHPPIRLDLSPPLPCSETRVRGVAWYPTSLGCWRLAFKSPRTHRLPGTASSPSDVHAADAGSGLEVLPRVRSERARSSVGNRANGG